MDNFSSGYLLNASDDSIEFTMNSAKDFFQLGPDQILDAIEKMGYRTTGQMYQLNSYENRVFDIFLEENERIICKFYRPQRWTRACIQEEHDFLAELKNSGLAVIAPLLYDGRESIFEHNGIFVTAFPKARGRSPDELLESDFEKIGTTLAHIHNIGSQKTAKHRPRLDTETFLYQPLDLLDKWIAPEMKSRYLPAAEEIAMQFEDWSQDLQYLRLQGDCHRGNLLYDGNEYFFLDFDDFCMGPATQDFWMLVQSADPDEEKQKLDLLLNSYEKIRHYNEAEIRGIPLLKGLRIIHYAAWIAKRWEDPSFPKLFPDFGSYTYWAEETEALEKIAWRSL